MTRHVKLIPIGDSLGIVIPDEVIARMQLRPGDSLTLDELSDALELRAASSDFDRQMEVIREVMLRRRGALSELAK